MRIAFISNFINHHQLPFCNALHKRLGEDFIFIQTEPMDEERKSMGWSDNTAGVSYVKSLYLEEERAICEEWIQNCEVLIAGWTDRTDLVIKRLESRKLTIRISERIYREGQWKAVSPRGLVAKYREHTKFRKYPAYLLCAGAYVPSDFNLVKAYPGKMYRFGYFPEAKKYHLDKLFAMKDSENTVEIIFAGRFMPLKHPEYMIRLAADLTKEGDKIPKFRIHMVGDGVMEESLKEMVKENNLQEKVIFYGFQTPEKVRSIMEKCHIHVFPSNELEGWGAVVNEAMNSGCAVVGSAKAGAVPYLIKQWENGVAYPDNNYDKMKEAVKYLMLHESEREEMGNKAYHTITDYWNADNAADTLLKMIEGWRSGRDCAPAEGPLSKAPVIAPSKMFGYMKKSGVRKDIDV